MYIVINSKNRTSGTPANFTTRLNNMIDQSYGRFKKFRVLKALIKGSIYNVNATNNLFVVESTTVNISPTPNDTYDYQFAIEPGNYDINTLASALQTQLRTMSNGSLYTVTSSLITGKLTIDSGSDTILFQLMGGYDRGINNVLGFPNTDSAVQRSLTGSYSVDLAYPSEIHIRSNVSSSSVFSDGLNSYGVNAVTDGFTDICEVIYPNQISYDNIVYEPIRPMEIGFASLTTISIRITDSNDNVLDLGANMQTSLVLQLIE